MLKILFYLWILRIRPTLGVLDTFTSRFRVMPWDLDANVHMNNCNYLKYLEKARIEHHVHTPYLWAQHIRKTHSLIVNTEISYLKSLMPLQAFTVNTRVASWDDKYVFFEQRFESRGETYAIALIRLAMLQKGSRISPREVLDRFLKGKHLPPLPASAVKLNELVAAQREESQRANPPPTASVIDSRADEELAGSRS